MLMCFVCCCCFSCCCFSEQFPLWNIRTPGPARVCSLLGWWVSEGEGGREGEKGWWWEGVRERGWVAVDGWGGGGGGCE